MTILLTYPVTDGFGTHYSVCQVVQSGNRGPYMGGEVRASTYEEALRIWGRWLDGKSDYVHDDTMQSRCRG